MIQTKKVFLDIDGVLADFVTHFNNWFDFEDKSRPSEYNDKRFVDNLHKVENDKDFWLLMPVLNSPDKINFKVDGYCTARKIPSRISELWLSRNGFPDAPVYTVANKVETLKKHNVDIFLDDGAHHVKELNEAGILTYLYSASHNQDYKTHLRVDTIEEFGAKTKTKFLILGHKEHGKSTLAEIINKVVGLTHCDSSTAANELFIFKALKDKYGYKTLEECFLDRRSKRDEWFDMICEYNTPNKSRLAEYILLNNDMYAGMRSIEELRSCNQKGMFDLVIGIFDPNKPLESETSFTIDIFKECDIIFWVNDCVDDLQKKVERLFSTIIKTPKTK